MKQLMEVKHLKYNKKLLKSFPQNQKMLLITLMMCLMRRVCNKNYLEKKQRNQKSIQQKIWIIKNNQKKKFQIYNFYNLKKIKKYKI